MLAGADIKKLKIIIDPQPAGQRDSTYDLTIGQILDSKRKSHTRFKLKPRHMVWAVSKETVDVPAHVTGLALNKSTLTSEGILALNFGVLDPNSNSPISTLLVNFGKQDYLLTAGTPFLRIAFFEHSEVPRERRPLAYADYVDARMATVERYFGDTFLDMRALKEEVFQRMARSAPVVLSVGGLIVGMIALVPGALQIMAASDLQRILRPVESTLVRFEGKQSELESRIRELEIANAALAARIESDVSE